MATNNVANDGTRTAHSLAIFQGTSTPTYQLLTNGQLLIGNTGADPTAATITAGTGISVTNAGGSITIASSGGGTTWTDVTGTSATLAVNNGYVADNAGLVTLTLPATATLGDTIKVVGKGAGGWTIAQNANQAMHLGNAVTTTGVGGSIASTNQYDCLEFVCITGGASTIWNTLSAVGNLTIV
jgi:hypothetical protein